MHVPYPRSMLYCTRSLLRKPNHSDPSRDTKKLQSAPKEWPYAIYASDRITDRKSAFLAHASTLSSAKRPSHVAQPIGAASTHKTCDPLYVRISYERRRYGGRKIGMRAERWGEGGSGDRLSRILELSGYENAAVVVWRWFGGVQLGSDRWRRISEVAKDALGKGQFQEINKY
ncbi:hypothetical protein BDQ17DRAFT_1346274 [Cyathus striatus]|nr:hypothetical protein BDQ17DRAFT_1346274 [Cyathus striatus]